jgi:hypothetical protein
MAVRAGETAGDCDENIVIAAKARQPLNSGDQPGVRWNIWIVISQYSQTHNQEILLVTCQVFIARF